MTQTEFESLGFVTRAVLETMAAGDGDMKAAAAAAGTTVRSVQSIMCRMRKRFGLSQDDLLDAVRNLRKIVRR